MEIKTTVNLSAAESISRFLTVKNPESFTDKDTFQIAETVIYGMFPEMSVSERALINRAVSVLLDYAALDGFQKGLRVAKKIALFKQQTSGP